jgi:phage terminase large subunit-like protein
MDRRIVHDADPTLAGHLRNGLSVPLGDHGQRLQRITRTSTRKIDRAIAAVIALAQVLLPLSQQTTKM